MKRPGVCNMVTALLSVVTFSPLVAAAMLTGIMADVDISLGTRQSSYEGLPIPVTARITNKSDKELEIDLWDVDRLPAEVMRIEFEDNTRRIHVSPQITDFSGTRVVVAPRATHELRGCMQQYYSGLPAGNHRIPYKFEWRAREIERGKVGPWQHLSGQGQLSFAVWTADEAKIDEFLSAATNLLKRAHSAEQGTTVAEELAFIESPKASMIVSALLIAGHEKQALDSVLRQTPAFSRALMLEYLPRFHNRAVVLSAFEAAQRRGLSLGDAEMRTFLNSTNTVVQWGTIVFLDRQGSVSLLDEIEELSRSLDSEVRSAAVRFLSKHQTNHRH